MEKYEFTGETKQIGAVKLHRIRALKDFEFVAAGDLGGWIEGAENLSHDGGCWVSGDAWDSGDAWVSGDARVSGDAQVSGNVFWISGIGSRHGTTTFFRCKDGEIRVTCGCFYGDLDEFLAKVEDADGDNKHGRVYEKGC